MQPCSLNPLLSHHICQRSHWTILFYLSNFELAKERHSLACGGLYYVLSLLQQVIGQ
jgi:hypothetical protein